MDFVYALRALRRNPMFVLAASLTLTIGVGAATAIFGVVHGVLLKPLPIRDQGRVLVLRKEQRTARETLFPFGVAELRAYAEQTRVLEAVAGVQYDGQRPSATAIGSSPCRAPWCLETFSGCWTCGPSPAGR